MTTGYTEWQYWKALGRRENPKFNAEVLHWGFYKTYAGSENGKTKYLPLGIWSENGKLIVEHNGKRLDYDIEPVRVRKLWVQSAQHYCSRAAYVAYISTGKWPTDVDEPKVAAAKVQPETMEFEATTIVSPEIVGGGISPEGSQIAGPPQSTAVPPPTVGLGHNSQASADPDAQLRDDIMEDSATIAEFYQKHSVSTKDEADIAEDRRQRLANSAKEANNKRREEKIPLEKLLADVDAKWNPVINAAHNAAALAKAKADVWMEAEKARLRKEAEDKAREAARVAAEAARKAHEEALERQRLAKAAQPAGEPQDVDLPFDLPPPPPAQAVAPVVETPRVLIGTQGKRRSIPAAPATATIVDLAKAAAYLAEIQHPDLIALVQKVGNAAAKSRTQVPGVVMSWEEQKQGAA